MANPVVDQLQRAIDAKHARAIEALKTVAEYLDEPLPAGNGHSDTPKSGRKRAPRSGTGRIRNAALVVFREGYLSIKEAAVKTGLTVAQIRGVASAPALKDGFQKKEIDGVMRYKYENGEAT